MFRRIVLAVTVVLVATSLVYSQQKPPHLEIELANTTYRGKVIFQGRSKTLLMMGDGQMKMIDAKDIIKVRKLTKPFKPFSAVEVKFQLAKEFGKRYEVVGTKHYLVVAAKGRAKKYAKVFEDILGSFRSYLSVRKIATRSPEFPLVAIVFHNQKSFAKYAMNEKVTSAGLLGYYNPLSNRVTLYESGSRISSLDVSDLKFTPDIVARHANASSLKDTIVHETTHQVAYNTGLHSRTGHTPKWVVEGMATVFEAPGIHHRSRGGTGMQKLNREMFLRLVTNLNHGIDQSLSLKRLVSSDSMFKSRTIDAYSQAWALNYFLMEKHSPEYSRYLKLLAKKNSTRFYYSKERLADFEKVFGKNIDEFQQHFIDYHTSLARKHLGRKSVTSRNHKKNFVSTDAKDGKKPSVKDNKRGHKHRRKRRRKRHIRTRTPTRTRTRTRTRRRNNRSHSNNGSGTRNRN